MKAVVQDLDGGRVTVGDVPAPSCQPGGVLVRTRRSLISIGTERAIIELAKKGPLGKAKDRPDLARKVLNKAKQEGYWSTYKVVRNLMKSPIPLGYSCAGEVLEVGAKAGEFRPGDRVACAGLGFANHAEVNYVPRNLVVKLPDACSFDSGCFATVGTIALHGVRLAALELGEVVVVLGLGLVGQMAAQLAHVSGARVIGTDLDPAKLELARQMGVGEVVAGGEALQQAVEAATHGHGADAVLVCAASKSDALIRQAVDLSRLRGRVVIVGDVGMHLERRPLFEKEVSVVVSRSYGPGRYDRDYEVHGLDYPLPYVRWTERRNMAAVVDLLGRGAVRVEPLITDRFTIAEAEQAYQLATGDGERSPIGIVLEYPGEARVPHRVTLRSAPPRTSADRIRLGVIGAGTFAKGVLFPAFAAQKTVGFEAFCTASGFTSEHVARRYGARFCSSDPLEVIHDEAVDAVLIATRHDQHAPLTTAALQAGKAVFVEKPLATTEESLAEVADAVAAASEPRLMVGFNRRFAPLAVRCKEFMADRQSPLFISYRVNAGALPADSWVLDPIEGGGRIVGEVCHFVDFLCFLTDAVPAKVYAEQSSADGERLLDRDGLAVTMHMTDGSVGVIQYLTNGDPSVAKEYCEIYGGGRTAILDNFRRASFHAKNRRRRERLVNQAKGHAEEVATFVRAVGQGTAMPIGFETLTAVTQSCFLIHQSLEHGRPIPYEHPRRQRS